MKVSTVKTWLGMILAFGFFPGVCFPSFAAQPESKLLKALIVTGQNNHDWKTTSSALKQILEDTGLFEANIAISPLAGQDMSKFSPDFSAYELVVLNYNGEDWSSSTQKDFVDYVRAGGGVVVYHAANNAFPNWKEYNELIGLAGFGNRNETLGPYVFWKDGKVARDFGPGVAGYHSHEHEYLVTNRNTEHPITHGLPPRWMHARDELYSLLRGHAEGIEILATAYSSFEQNGTGRDEPVLFTVRYGKGRVFHTVLGHAAGENLSALECVGFIVTFQRGAEWAGSGRVTQEVPGDFPAVFRDSGTSDDVRRWKNFRPLLLDEILKKVSTYEYGDDEEVLSELRAYVRANRNSSQSMQRCEEKLAEFLKSKATLAAKMAVCRQLRLIGTSASVPVLGGMLLEPQTSDMARYALEKITEISAEKALVEGLSKSKGKIRIGIVSSLGARRAQASVLLLERLIYDSDYRTAAAAVAALGQVVNPEAASSLSRALDKTKGQLQSQVASSLLKCAEEYQAKDDLKTAAGIYSKLLSSKLLLPIRKAAMEGVIASSGNDSRKLIIDVLKSKEKDLHEPAIDMIEEVFDESSIQEICLLLPDLPSESQVQLLPVLSHYRNDTALAAVSEATKSKEGMVRIAALASLENLGNASTVELLAWHGAKGDAEEQKAARNSLWRLSGSDIDQAILLNLIKSPDPDIQNELILSIGERRVYAGQSLLFDKARSSNSKTCILAIRALKEVASPSDIPRLVELLLNARNETEEEEIGNTIAATAGKISWPALPADAIKAILPSIEDTKGRCTLYRVLGKIGDDGSLPLLRRALAEGNAEIYNASVRALADWPTITPRDDLLQVARVSTNPVHQVLALRGYLRMIGAEKNRMPQAAVHSLREALTLSRRPEEKKLILSLLPAFAGNDALELAESLCSDEQVKAEAMLAIEKIKEELKKKQK